MMRSHDDLESVVEPRGLPYTFIGDNGKAQVLAERAARLEAEHYSHSLNVKLADSVGDEKQVNQSKMAMVAIEGALEVITAEIQSLGATA